MKRIFALLLIFLIGAQAALAEEVSLEIVRELAAMQDELEWSDLAPYGGTDIGSGMYIRSFPVTGGEYNLWVGGSEDEIEYLQLRSCENSLSYVDLWSEDLDAFLQWDHRVGRFRYDRVVERYILGDPGVNPYPFRNTDPFPVCERDSAINRAEAECTIGYNAVDVQYDPLSGVWMVLFYTSSDAETIMIGGDQSVYMSSDGITLLVVYGE